MKKILALVLALLMVLSLCACGAKDAPAEGELPTITLWSSGSQNVADTFNELINMYNAKPDRKANVAL